MTKHNKMSWIVVKHDVQLGCEKMRTNYGDEKDTMWDNCVLDVVMHGEKNAEFGNLIPGKCCFWREIFAILWWNLSFRWIHIHIFDIIFYLIPGKFCFWREIFAILRGNSSFRSEVFKLWVATQTWVARALILGRGPFCNP